MLADLPWNVIALQLFFGLALGCVYVLLASGLSIIYGLLDVVDFCPRHVCDAWRLCCFRGHFLVWELCCGHCERLRYCGPGGRPDCIFFLLKPLYGKDPLLPLLLTFGLSVAIPDGMKILFGLIGKPVYPPL